MEKVVFLFSVLFFLSCDVYANHHGELNANIEASVEKSADKHINQMLKDPRLHSASIVVYNKGESFIHHYGELEIGKSNKPHDNAIYEIGSVTKTYTGTLVAQAILEKKIRLDDDVRKYLKKYRTSDYPNLEYNGVPVTIKHLVTHTSNFPNFPIRGESKEDFFEGLKEVSMDKEPGSHYSYSSMAPELMAFILESVYSEPYEILVEKYITKKQKMSHTRFTLTELEDKRRVRGYNGEGKLMPNFTKNLWGGMVGLNSTPQNILKYIKLQLDKDNPIVAESHKSLYQIREDLAVGYYWYIQNADGDVSYRHHGGIYGMQNWLIIYPEHNIGICLISNASFDGMGDLLEEVINKVFNDINH